ncbi:alpha-galactosidase [Lentisphaera marina]|uniref:glycoside hydrolase family 36 protein n=1 Tax=Lentisphaera marina TaxID=1111041 RepID=UPI0023659EE8|nr:glycoside hydrolase family 36 protein [Lentisphaera marina]MDD7984401.1 alpha-galactosidase [Lentisphaera marina]
MNLTFSELSRFQSHDCEFVYFKNDTEQIALRIYPKGMNIPAHRENIDDLITSKSILKAFGGSWPAYKLHDLVQIKCVGENAPSSFSAGSSLRSTESNLVFKDQITEKQDHQVKVKTFLNHSKFNLSVEHQLSFSLSDDFCEVQTKVINQSSQDIQIEHLSSFCLDNISPFQTEDGKGTYYLHRFLSTWSAEGKHEVRSIEDLNFERSWAGHGVRSLRFGQVGSMPVKDFFPFIGVEDRHYGVMWGAQLACPGSWQMELYRLGDFLSISGGQGDREHAHWLKTLKPQQKFTSPKAFISCCKGNIEDLQQRLLKAQTKNIASLPKTEKELPIIFNDWCTTWGHPSEENILKIADTLKSSHVKYLVMDDGWFNDTPGCQQGLGDWNVSKTIYPNGFKHLCDTLKEKGFIPGIWFEFENCTEGSELFERKDLMIHVDGHVLQRGSRRFLDFRKQEVHDYLNQKVVKTLKDNGISYIKIDYNDSIGLGCDSSESLGEGLRQHLEGVQNFYKHMREEIPELVIEVCSSGGHRLEPSFMELASMGGFSDSHEGLDIPIIAANTAMQIPMRKNQIWAVLREDDSETRVHYSMAATFMGRMCLSGDLFLLNDQQKAIMQKGQEFYLKIKDLIADGHSKCIRKGIDSYLYPEGYQIFIRYANNKEKAFLVIHTFENHSSEIRFDLKEDWVLGECFKQDKIMVSIQDKILSVKGIEDFCGLIIELYK